MEIIFAIAMITGAFCYYQNNKISITNLKVKGKVNNRIRIVQISDLHSKEFGKNNTTLYKIIMKQKRLIVCILVKLLRLLQSREQSLLFLLHMKKTSID